ncbi:MULTISPECIES: AbrB/MazE/SpoVT family DNA-binding domain-containing protein [unclassified Thiocapsa]
MLTVTVSDKGQVAIPAEIRHRLGIAPGTKLTLEPDVAKLSVRPLRKTQRTRPETSDRLRTELRSARNAASERLRCRAIHARDQR